jgi:hypothetical protein
MTQQIDITELLFPMQEETDLGRKLLNLWSRASEEAFKLVGSSSPIALIDKTRAIYRTYLESEGIEYDEERGF